MFLPLWKDGVQAGIDQNRGCQFKEDIQVSPECLSESIKENGCAFLHSERFSDYSEKLVNHSEALSESIQKALN